MSTTQERIQRHLRQLAPHQRNREAGKLLAEANAQLEAAKQRELELLAVIEKMIDVLVTVDDEYCYSNDDRVTDVLRTAEERRKK